MIDLWADIPLPVLGWAAFGILAAGITGVCLTLGSIPAPELGLLGPRGLARRRAHAESPLAALIDPLVRLVAGWIARLPIDEQRASVDRKLVEAGHYRGLTADELFATAVLFSITLAFAGAGIAAWRGWGVWFPITTAALGLLQPFSQLADVTGQRNKQIERRLPDVVDLVALCMGAGLDFPGALRRVLDEGLPSDTPIHGELAAVVSQLELGQTRTVALTGFAERVPVRSVRDFVGAVVQAEEKGTPLAEVLGVQARVLRTRRSVLAEEAAARAAMQLMIPLVFIFIAIMMLLMGPVALTIMEA